MNFINSYKYNVELRDNWIEASNWCMNRFGHPDGTKWIRSWKRERPSIHSPVMFHLDITPEEYTEFILLFVN